MAFNIGNSISGALAGAGTGASFGGYGALIGAGVGALAGGFTGSSNASSAYQMSMQDMYNLEMYNTMKDLYMMNVQNNYNQNAMKYSNELNKNSMRYGTDLQKELNAQAFKYNNYFLDNAYQKTVADMRKAGINPILAAGNSNVGSAQSGGVSSAGTSALGVSGATGNNTDPSSMMTAFANSSNATTNKQKLALDLANTISDVNLKFHTSAKAQEEAKTEKTVQELNRGQAVINYYKGLKERVESESWPDWMKAQIKEKLSSAEYNYTMAEVENYLKEAKRYNLVTSANAQWESATTGSPTRAILQFIRGITGTDTKGNGGYIRDKFTDDLDRIKTKDKSFNQNDVNTLKFLYDALGLDKYGVPFGSPSSIK